MSCIVYITNKNTNTKYAYRSESYRDPLTKKPKSRRTYLGRVDPETNEIIPKAANGKRNRTPVQSGSAGTASSSGISPQIVTSLQKQLDNLQKQQTRVMQEVSTVNDLIAEIRKEIDLLEQF